MQDFIQEIPKVELHVHLEGSMRRELIERLAAQSNVSLPPNFFSEQGTIFWRDFVKDFLPAYDKAAGLIKNTAALYEVIYDYLVCSSKNNVIYVELTISPQLLALVGVSYGDYLKAAKSAIEQVKRDGYEIDARLIVVLVRHMDKKGVYAFQRQEDAAEAAMELVKQVIAYQRANKEGAEYVVGIGLAGDEENFPVRYFSQALCLAKEAEIPLTIHAGEHTDYREVLEAVALGANRIDHGISVAFEPSALKEIVARKIHLALCLASNYNLVDSLKGLPDQHPIKQLHVAGVRWSVNTDDPPFFLDRNGELVSMCTEYRDAQRLLDLTPTQLLVVTLWGIEDSFAPPVLKAKLLGKVRAFAKAHQLTI